MTSPRMSKEDEFFHAVERFSCVTEDMSAQVRRMRDWSKSLAADLRKAPDLGALKQGSELGSLAQTVGEEIAAAVESWDRRWEASDQARIFGESFNDRVVLLVFGKVNAGKSSFCNLFVERFRKQGGSARFFYLKGGRRVYVEEEFAEGAIETTARIQGVELGEHLVLIDTPGLHSATVENGELTQRYTDAADGVLWLTASTAPGEVQELAALKEELARGKPLCAVVTRSDEKKRAVVAGRVESLLRNKSPENRALQEAYVLRAAREHMPPQEAALLREAISVSALYARENPDRPEAMQEAGFERLFASLSKLAGEALIYKRGKPLQIARAHTRQVVVQDVEKQVKPRLRRLGEEAKKAEAKLLAEAPDVAGAVVGEVSARLGEEIDRHKEAGDMNGLVAALEDVARRSMARHLQRALSAHLESIDDVLFEISAQSLSGYERMTVLHREAVKTKGSGFLSWLVGSAVKKIAEALLPPGVGKAVGFAAGKLIGDVVGEELAGGQRTQEIFVGMSGAKLRAEISAQIQKSLPAQIEREIQRNAAAFRQLADHARRMDEQIERRLSELRQEDEQALQPRSA